MTFTIENHRLHKDGEPVLFKESPNRGGQIEPSFIVEHHTGGHLDGKGSVSWLCNPDANASAHTVIDYWGHVTQLVPFNVKAWHAGGGSSSFKGMSPNSHSIGHELANPGRLVDIGGGKYQQDGGNVVIDSSEYPVEWIEADWDRGFYVPFSAEQIAVNTAINRALRDAYPTIADVTTHQICDPTRKVDPHPGFDLEAMQTALEVPHTDVADLMRSEAGARRGITTDFVRCYAWDSYDTPMEMVREGREFVIADMKAGVTREVDGAMDTRTWYKIALGRSEVRWLREGDIKVST